MNLVAENERREVIKRQRRLSSERGGENTHTLFRLLTDAQ